jgi:hypothetical protein
MAARAYGSTPTPDRDLDRTIAHLLRTAEVNAGHLDVHSAAAAKSVRDPVLLAHHLKHSAAHAGSITDHLVKLRTAVARRLPAVASQLDDLGRETPGNRAAGDTGVPRAALDMSIAHDLASAQVATAHTARHLYEAQAAQAAGNQVSVVFNLEHATHHVTEISHNLSELDTDLTRRLPAVGRELGTLAAAVTAPEGPPRPAGYGGPEPA